MEKIAPLKRVEVFVDEKEAVVEFENAAVSYGFYCPIAILIAVQTHRKLANFSCAQSLSRSTDTSCSYPKKVRKAHLLKLGLCSFLERPGRKQD